MCHSIPNNFPTEKGMELAQAVDTLQTNQANAPWFVPPFASLLFLTHFFTGLGQFLCMGVTFRSMEKMQPNAVSKPTHHSSADSSWKRQLVPIARGSSSTSQPTAALSTSCMTTQGVHATHKPGQGRPKGSTSTTPHEERPHRLGRPPGTGHLQRARALAVADGPQQTKRPVGQPRKLQATPVPVPPVSDESQPEKRPVGRPRKLQVAPVPPSSVKFQLLV